MSTVDRPALRRVLLGIGIGASTLGLLASQAPPSAATDGAPRAAGADSLTVTIVNKNPNVKPGNIWVFAQQTPTGQSSPVVVAAPQTLATRSTFTLGAVNAGKVYLAFGNPKKPNQVPLAPPPAAAPSPDTSPVRFDSVELSFPGQGNLTSVDMFGIPLDLATYDAAGNLVASKKWSCYTDAVRRDLQKKLTSAGGRYDRTVRSLDAAGNARAGTSGQFLRVVSPNIASGLNPSGYPNLTPYVASVKDKTLRVRGRYDSTTGGPSLTYDYSGKFTGSPSPLGTLVLTDRGPNHLKSITLTGKSLVGSSANLQVGGIYSNNSEYFLAGNLKQPHYVGENDVYAAAYRDVVAGFAWGYWGSPRLTNDSATFNVSKSPGPFTGAQPTKAWYNAWAAALFPHTLSYGFPFADTFNDSPSRSPLLTMPPGGRVQITINPDVSPKSCLSSTPPVGAPAQVRSIVSQWQKPTYIGKVGRSHTERIRISPGVARKAVLQYWAPVARTWRNGPQLTSDSSGYVNVKVPFAVGPRTWRVFALQVPRAARASHPPATFVGLR